jgi:hypothetical protein
MYICPHTIYTIFHVLLQFWQIKTIFFSCVYLSSYYYRFFLFIYICPHTIIYYYISLYTTIFLAGQDDYSLNLPAGYADLCWPMLTYADLCWPMLTYADLCWRMLTIFLAGQDDSLNPPAGYADVCWRMLTYPIFLAGQDDSLNPPAGYECWRMLTYADVPYISGRARRFFEPPCRNDHSAPPSCPPPPERDTPPRRGGGRQWQTHWKG